MTQVNLGRNLLEGKKIAISAAIITKNEAERLAGCLESLSLADEVIVVDSGSVDNTLEIARHYNCKVFQEEWKGYGLQKQSAIDKCSHEWVLVVDADERIPPATWTTIGLMLQNHQSETDAFNFPRKNSYNGRWLKHGYEWPDRVTRLLNRGRARMDGSIVHENVVAARIMELDVSLIHLKRYAMDDYLQKLNSYSTFLAKQTVLSNPHRKSSVTTAFLSFLGHFGRAYVLKKGFLDGKEGLIIAFTEALHSFYKHIKILELQGKIINS